MLEVQVPGCGITKIVWDKVHMEKNVGLNCFLHYYFYKKTSNVWTWTAADLSPTLQSKTTELQKWGAWGGLTD